MRFVILHYHVLKNAGSTIEEILERSFRGKFSRLDTTDLDGHVTHAALLTHLQRNPHIQAVSSHQIRYPMPRAAGFLFFDICFLRDPIDRIRSMYDYFREKPNPADPVSAIANQSSLGDFIARLIERIPHQVQDVQVQLLANGDVYDHTPAEDDLERAIRRMRNTSLLGVLDLFSESLIAGQYFLRPVFPSLDCAQPAVNVSRGAGGTLDMRVSKLRAACDPRVYAELLRMNALDRQLLALAREEVDRRFRLVPNQEARLHSLGQPLETPVRREVSR